MLPALLDQIPQDQFIDAVTADGAFDTRACHAAIAARGAQAVIPPRKNGKPWKENTPGAHVRNEALRASRRFGRAIWRRWSGYHRRSRVETKMRCFKALGERIVSRDFERQVAELHIRVAVLNRFTVLGTPVTQRVAWVCPGKGQARASDALRNRAPQRPSSISASPANGPSPKTGWPGTGTGTTIRQQEGTPSLTRSGSSMGRDCMRMFASHPRIALIPLGWIL